jgi:hypothetical protein
MIDRAARSHLSERIRQFVAGQITNDQFSDGIPHRSPDRAVEAVRDGAWGLYDDTREYRLVGKFRLNLEARQAVARWILFLLTDLEYEWPRVGPIAMIGLLLAGVLTVGLVRIPFRLWFERHGDFAAWPFIRVEDLEEARKHPRYLAGAV